MTSKIFPARFLFNGCPVVSEYSELVLAIPAEMVIQSFFADFAPYAGFRILPPEHDNFAVKNISLFRRRKPQIVWLAHILLLGKQSRHPARGERRREDKAKRRALTLRCEHPPLD